MFPNASERQKLKERKDAALKAARDLVERCDREGRNFTKAERDEVNEHMKQARIFASDLQNAELLHELSEGIGEQLGQLGRGPGGGGRKGRDGSWATKMRAHLSGVGAKGLTTAGSITVPAISNRIEAATDRPRSILQLIPLVAFVEGDRFGYIREVTRNHAASTVAVGKRKPESGYELELVEDRARTIAHLTTVDRKLVADVVLLSDYLEGALSDGLMLELEDQVLNGDGSQVGVLDNLTGILQTSGTQAQAWDTDRITTARRAVTKLENLNRALHGAAFVMSPNEWESFELTRSVESFVMGPNRTFSPGDANGGLIPVDRAKRQLWGYSVVTSTAMADGSMLFGDFGGSARIREREDIEIAWSESGYVEDLFGPGLHGDLAEANKMRIRAEGRWGLEVNFPAAFIEVDLTPPP